ncbi:MAG: hypothetical protein EBS70_07870 [Actinobacteria bacterium]|jgi:hypothetical protein|nr:hypothetical protein [Actinomycetota bacterium]
MNEPETMKEVRRLLWQARALVEELLEKDELIAPDSTAYEEWDAIHGSIMDTDQLILDMDARIWEAK